MNDLISTKIPGKGKVFKVNNEDAEFQKLNQMALESDESVFSIYDDIINDKKKNKNLFIKAFRYFVKHFNDFKLKDITIFRDQFLNIKIISICSSQDEEVYNIFEILNARGVYLKQVELLKNYMFKYLQPKYLMDTYKKEWMQLEEITEKIDLDDYYLHFLRCYYYKNGMKKEQIFDITKDLLLVNFLMSFMILDISSINTYFFIVIIRLF